MTPLKVLFLGFALPEEDFEQLLRVDQAMPVQTQRFGWSVVEALGSAGIDVRLVSAAPASDYPRCSQVVFRGGAFTERGVSGTRIGFVNIIVLKHLSRYVTALRALRRTVRASSPDAIVVHGVVSSLIWAGVRASRRHRLPLVVLMTDPPSQRHPHDHALATALKRVDRRVIGAGLRRVDGVIAVTRRLADDYAPASPALVLEGIAPAGTTSLPPETEIDRSLVVYAGGLREDYGVAQLLHAVQESAGGWRLALYGRGPMEAAIQAAAKVNPRIVYGGLVDPVRLQETMARAQLLVNPRPPSAGFTPYSFPSKLLEYLVAGRPVLSTRLPGIPPEYGPLLSWTDPDSTSLAAAIDDLVALPPATVDAKGEAGRRFALESRGPAAQGERLRGFLESLSGRRSGAEEHL